MSLLDNTILSAICYHAGRLEDYLDTNLISYFGPIDNSFLNYFREFIEGYIQRLGNHQSATGQPDFQKKNALSIVLTTHGGSVEAVEKMVEITRHHYNHIYFIVPAQAMSAGTIWCMSGDKILMDYTSSLGPIDPQVLNKENKWVPALGYLDMFERLVQKSRDGTISSAEFSMLQNSDLAELRRYEQARDLSVTLLKDWLVRYKFKNWTEHRTDPEKRGEPVTKGEKQQRAEEIAEALGNNSLWHSHGRMIGIKTLVNMLRLEIDDYTDDNELRMRIMDYHDLLLGYMQSRSSAPVYLHHRLLV